jgi:hypothetical protein
MKYAAFCGKCSGAIDVVFEIKTEGDDARGLTLSVLQIIALLDMYQAELARILHLKCGDIGELASAQRYIEPGTGAWGQAQLFVRFYRALYIKKKGDGVAMRHWLQVEHKELGGVPHLLIVDKDRLPDVVAYLERCTQQADAPS